MYNTGPVPYNILGSRKVDPWTERLFRRYSRMKKMIAALLLLSLMASVSIGLAEEEEDKKQRKAIKLRSDLATSKLNHTSRLK